MKVMIQVRLVEKKVSTLHDFPYSGAERKCPHFWIINVTPPGPEHCLHRCVYCYARDAVFSDYSPGPAIYRNLPELVERDLDRIELCPPVSISNVADPCQDIPELKAEVTRLVRLLTSRGVALCITTKGDPGFLLDLPGFVEYKPKCVAVTIEGTADVLRLLSPAAPPFEARLDVVRRLARLGVSTLVRFDPAFVHLFQALYGEAWFEKVEAVMQSLADAGARHVVASTGRLSKKRAPHGGQGSWHRVEAIVQAHSLVAARRFAEEYAYERGGTSQGYLLKKELRQGFHRRLREVAHSLGMTYAVCQELGTEADTPGLAHCERFLLPFSRKGADGRFSAIEGCTANCHVTCRGQSGPPCGQPGLIVPSPYRLSLLRRAAPKPRLPL